MPDPSPQPDVDSLWAVVAIDGPSGAGKSTVARAVAARLGFAYLDTGAMYRAVTWALLEADVLSEDAAGVARVVATLELAVRPDGAVWVGGRDVSAHLRAHMVEARVSAVSALPVVRARMRDLQRAVAGHGPVVAEGRDMASVVFPAARWKFFLDACPEERARRRQRDFAAAGREVGADVVLEEMAVRDRLDSTRKDAPLTRAQDAEYVDTTGMSLDQVVDHLAQRVRERGEPGGPGRV